MDSRGVLRRRECLKCTMRFSTEEVIITKPVKSPEKKKRQTKKPKSPEKKKRQTKKPVKNILPLNNWQQPEKNTSARQKLEALRDNIKEDDY